MRADDRILAEPLIPHRGRMRLIEWVKEPSENGLEAEATAKEGWPLHKEGTISSLLCIELAAQAVSALRTWHQGEGAVARIGLLVGVKEAEFSSPCIPIGARLSIQIKKLYQVGHYAVFQSRIRTESGFSAEIAIQVMEPEEDILSFLKAQPVTEAEKKERKS